MERAGLFLYDPTLRVVRPMGSAGVDPDLLDGVEGTLEETPVAQRALAEDSVVEISEGLERQVTSRPGSCLGPSAITGEIVHVDGGFHCVRGALVPTGESAPLSEVT